MIAFLIEIFLKIRERNKIVDKRNVKWNTAILFMLSDYAYIYI